VNEMQPFVSHLQASELMQPCDRTLDDPARLAQPASMCGAPLGQNRRNAHSAKRAAVGGGVVGAVALDPIGALAGAPGSARKRRNGNDERKELGYIMGIGRRERRRERDAPCIADEMVLAASFAPVSGIGSGFFPPCMARTEELSTTVRDHSICSAACNRVSNTRCNRAHTPARCHATKRRQQLTPEPQPISRGSAVHGMPVRSTNRMPVSACRWAMGLRPGWVRRRRFTFGNNGSTSCHSRSSRIGLGMNILPLRESIHVKKYRSTHQSTTPIHHVNTSF
jgi:hypothetical protein